MLRVNEMLPSQYASWNKKFGEICTSFSSYRWQTVNSSYAACFCNDTLLHQHRNILGQQTYCKPGLLSWDITSESRALVATNHSAEKGEGAWLLWGRIAKIGQLVGGSLIMMRGYLAEARQSSLPPLLTLTGTVKLVMCFLEFVVLTGFSGVKLPNWISVCMSEMDKGFTNTDHFVKWSKKSYTNS